MEKEVKIRTVHHADALKWLAEQPILSGCSLVSSLPDFSEFPSLSITEWKGWFSAAAKLIFERTPEDGVAIFYQRDSKQEGTWIEKGYLIQKAAELSGHELLWHKIVCRAPPGNITFGRPAYSHLLCFSKKIRAPLEKSTADVLPAPGETTWTRGMGVKACQISCQFILDHTTTRTVVDPFCGHGTVLAVANAMGLKAIGVELSRKRAERAERLEMPVPGRLRG
jgi:hypothetical protein